jgi:Flp pilus assembly pilin Flp
MPFTASAAILHGSGSTSVAGFVPASEAYRSYKESRMARVETMHKLRVLLVRACREDEGQALVEYALLISLIAIVCFAAVGTFGLQVSRVYSQILSVYPR